MGACLGCLKRGGGMSGQGSSGGDLEMSEVPSKEATCSLGKKGAAVQVKLDAGGIVHNVEGLGTVIASCALDCDVAYWEVVLGKNPSGVRVGIKRFDPKHPTSLDDTLEGNPAGAAPSWVLEHADLHEGDVIGVRWDQTDLPMLSFLKNGKLLDMASINRVRPAVDVYPAVSVQKGSKAQVIFDQRGFKYPPTGTKFKMIVCATSII